VVVVAIEVVAVAVEARTAAAPRLTAGTNLFANSRARSDLPARALFVWRRF